MRNDLKPAVFANLIAVVAIPLIWLSGYIFGMYWLWFELVILSPVVFGVFAFVITISVFWHVGFSEVPHLYYLLILVQPISLVLAYIIVAVGFSAI